MLLPPIGHRASCKTPGTVRWLGRGMKLGSVGDKGLAGVRWCRLLREEAVGAAGLGMDGLW